MKQSAFFLVLSIALCLPLLGCKKSGETPAASGNTATDKPIPSNEPVNLQPKWVVDNRYSQRMELVQNLELSMPQLPKPMKQSTSMGQDYSITVLNERPGGGRDLELEFLSVEMDVSMGGTPVMAFDSKGESLDDSKNPAASMFRSLIGTRLKFALDASNRVEKIDGVKEFAARVNATASPETKQMMQGIFNEDYFKQLVDQSKYLPAQPVKPGAAWSSHPEVPSGPFGVMIMDLNYVFKNWETHEKRKCALLEFTGPIRTKEESSNASPGLMGMKMFIEDGNVSGKTWFDPELGAIVESALDMTMNLRMIIPAQGGAGGASAPQTIRAPLNQKIKVKLVEVSSTAK